MDGRSLILSVVAAICVGYLAPAHGATQADYTVPARELLFTGTLSGLADAYQILNNGMGDESVTGDKRELILLHVVARAGMLVFDRDDVAVNTSLLEIAQPFGVAVTGDKLFPEDPCDPDRVVVTWPINPADPNCLLIPPGADVEAAASAINVAILPEVESILATQSGYRFLDVCHDPYPGGNGCSDEYRGGLRGCAGDESCLAGSQGPTVQRGESGL